MHEGLPCFLQNYFSLNFIPIKKNNQRDLGENSGQFAEGLTLKQAPKGKQK